MGLSYRASLPATAVLAALALPAHADEIEIQGAGANPCYKITELYQRPAPGLVQMTDLVIGSW
jgi:hypothetical protein